MLPVQQVMFVNYRYELKNLIKKKKCTAQPHLKHHRHQLIITTIIIWIRLVREDLFIQHQPPHRHGLRMFPLGMVSIIPQCLTITRQPTKIVQFPLLVVVVVVDIV